MSRAKRILLWLMALAYSLAGFDQLLNPEFYMAIVPPGLQGFRIMLSWANDATSSPLAA